MKFRLLPLPVVSTFICSLFISLFLLPSLSGQSETTSALGGLVRDDGFIPISNAAISLIHEPTGTEYTDTSRPDGTFRFTALRPGGPYTLKVTAEGFAPWQLTEVNLFLQRQGYEIVTLPKPGENDLIQLEPMSIIADSREYKFDPTNMGSGTTLDTTDISSLPTIARSLTDIIRLDPRMAVFDRDSGAISAGGKSTKYNSFSIDGVVTKDTFGLNENGQPSLKQPYSFETIAQVSVQTNPYDVAESGFTGANVKAITKSGTNKFKGSIYGFYRDDSMSGVLYDTNGEEVAFRDFTEYTYGFTLGGPVIKNKLFFFANYESSLESRIHQVDTFAPYEVTVYKDNKIELYGYDLIKAKSMELYGFDPGDLYPPGEAELTDDKYLLKLDWNINRDHRMTLRYNYTRGQEPRYQAFGESERYSLSTHWWSQIHENMNYSGEMFSNWTDMFSTEIKVAFNQYEKKAQNNSDLPQIEISNMPNRFHRTTSQIEDGPLLFGQPSQNHANELYVDTSQLYLKANYNLGSHIISFGLQGEKVDNSNLFIPDYRGRWRFNSPERYVLGIFDNYFVTRPVDGTNGAAEWSLYNLGIYGQDEWKIGKKLTVNIGVRVDIPFVPNSPKQARPSPNGKTFAEVFGQSNTNTIDGNYVFQPRFGFNYAIDEDRKTQVRGGVGIFYGSAPHVWLSTTYVNNGQTLVDYIVAAGEYPDFPFIPDGKNPYIPNTPETEDRVDVDYLDKDFKLPTDMKWNIAIDRQLPWLAMELTLEAQWSLVQNDVQFVNDNLNLDIRSDGSYKGYTPDGRERYGFFPLSTNSPLPKRHREEGYKDVIRLTNTNKGRSENYTVLLQRKMHNNIAFSAGYTYQDSKSVNDGLGSSAFANWRSNVALNPNAEELSTSRYETRHRFISNISYMFKWGKAGRTTMSLVYDGRSGRPFSYLAQVKGGIVDLNNDGNQSNDLLYVPTGLDDPIVSWGGGRQQNIQYAESFMAYVESQDGLRPYKGQIVPRNTGRSPFIHQFDFKVSHIVKIWYDHELEVSVSVLNIGNLIDDNWGKEIRPKDGDVRVIEVGHLPGKSRSGKGNEFGHYQYDYDADLLKYDEQFESRSISSRWALLLGVTYRF